MGSIDSDMRTLEPPFPDCPAVACQIRDAIAAHGYAKVADSYLRRALGEHDQRVAHLRAICARHGWAVDGDPASDGGLDAYVVRPATTGRKSK